MIQFIGSLFCRSGHSVFLAIIRIIMRSLAHTKCESVVSFNLFYIFENFIAIKLMYKIPIKIYSNINYHFKSFSFGLTFSLPLNKILHSVPTQSDWIPTPKLSFWIQLCSIELLRWISSPLIYLEFNLNF